VAAGWYILHVYSGYENRIEKKIHLLRESGELDKDVVREVKIPTEEVAEMHDGKKRTQKKKVLPGYLLLEIDFPEDGWKGPCQVIRSVNGVAGFVGTPANRKPSPLSGEEARALLARTGDIKGEKAVRTRQNFNVGDTVKITAGPFESFSGTIDEVNLERSKLKVMVGIFGRNTPVEVDFTQVEKA
jgi:transcriptional antiterminator NusG